MTNIHKINKVDDDRDDGWDFRGRIVHEGQDAFISAYKYEEEISDLGTIEDVGGMTVDQVGRIVVERISNHGPLDGDSLVEYGTGERVVIEMRIRWDVDIDAGVHGDQFDPSFEFNLGGETFEGNYPYFFREAQLTDVDQ